MKAISTNQEPFESTYALLVRSEEKQRSRFEAFVYTMLVVSTIFAVAQFGRQAVTIPASVARAAVIASVVPQRA